MIRSLPVFAASLALAAALAAPSRSAVLEFGDEDLSNTGIYPSDPKAGATLESLAADAVTYGAGPIGHGYPFAPSVGEFPGTDQIFVGSVQFGYHDGYSNSSPTAGPQVLTLNYSSLVPAGKTIATLTLGVGADDFQQPEYAQPFSASINGSPAPALAAVLNSLSQGGPISQFFTIGVAPGVLSPTHVLTLSIDNGGDGGDGWSVDFLTVGVTLTPEPTSSLLIGMAAAAAAALGSRRRRSS